MNRMQNIYPVFGSRFSDDQSRADWIDLWCECCGGMTAAEIRRALNRCAMDESDWPPKPGKFVRMGKPTSEELGLPSDQQAFRSWLKMVELPPDIRDWSKVHPAVAWCHKYLASDYFTLRQKPEKDQFKAFMEFWQEARKMAQEGESFGAFLPAPDKAEKAPEKPQEGGKPKTKAEIAAPHIKAIRGLLDKVHVNA